MAGEGIIGDILNFGSQMTGNLISGASALGQYKLGKENLQLQKDNLAYQQGIQQEIFRREDTAMQRQVADLKAAGLSPALAAGGGANAGAVVATTAPQQSGEAFEGLGRTAQQVAETRFALDVMTQKANIAHTEAETRAISDRLELEKEKLGLAKQEFGENVRHHGATEGMTQQQINNDVTRLGYELERIGISREQLTLDARRVLVQENQLELNRALNIIRGADVAGANLLRLARIGQITHEEALFELKKQGMEASLAALLLDNTIRQRDLDISIETAIRYKDTQQYNFLEDTTPKRDFTWWDYIFGSPDHDRGFEFKFID